ncbi:MAG: DUF6011 domain-containing protein [Candidatus Thermoplasmatota archaeon]|nr:DUF6011 domain-containing protein [Candidatus Thermoplasmatota archaeon]
MDDTTAPSGAVKGTEGAEQVSATKNDPFCYSAEEGRKLTGDYSKEYLAGVELQEAQELLQHAKDKCEAAGIKPDSIKAQAGEAVAQAVYCRICHRELTNQKHKAAGVGPVCAKKEKGGA